MNKDTSSTFTDKLNLETKNSHTQVDKHDFVSLIRTDKIAGNFYINFNKYIYFSGIFQIYLENNKSISFCFLP